MIYEQQLVLLSVISQKGGALEIVMNQHYTGADFFFFLEGLPIGRELHVTCDQ
jgi:hypothetical protein